MTGKGKVFFYDARSGNAEPQAVAAGERYDFKARQPVAADTPR